MVGLQARGEPPGTVESLGGADESGSIRRGCSKLIITVRPTVFEAAAEGGSASVETITPAASDGRSRFVSEEVVASARPELGAAKIIVSGGRALGSEAEFKAVMEPLADVLGAAITDRLRQAGLDVGCVFADGRAQTSATVVAVEPGGERVFFHTPGVTKLLDAAVFRRCIPTFATCDVVQVGYFGLLPALTPELPNVLAELKGIVK